MTTCDFANLMGVTRQEVHNWETGKRKVTRQTEKHLELVVSMADILQGYVDIFQVRRIGLG